MTWSALDKWQVFDLWWWWVIDKHELISNYIDWNWWVEKPTLIPNGFIWDHVCHNLIFEQIIKIKYNWEWGLRQHEFKVKGWNYQN
jgi:hypothetical protein